jgi:hypothetical protein
MTIVASGYDRKHLDLYETEEWAVEALLRHFSVKGSFVWEPAAGNHKMADVLEKAGAKVLASDVETFDRKHDFTFDFLSNGCGPFEESGTAIITNPPYGQGNRDAVKFCRLALERCPGLVAMLLTAKFDFGKTRAFLFRDNPRFMAKIALLDRIQWFPGETGGTEDHAWYVWGPAQFASTPRMYWEGRQ